MMLLEGLAFNLLLGLAGGPMDLGPLDTCSAL
jgi:hypothetical protein